MADLIDFSENIFANTPVPTDSVDDIVDILDIGFENNRVVNIYFINYIFNALTRSCFEVQTYGQLLGNDDYTYTICSRFAALIVDEPEDDQAIIYFEQAGEETTPQPIIDPFRIRREAGYDSSDNVTIGVLEIDGGFPEQTIGQLTGSKRFVNSTATHTHTKTNVSHFRVCWFIQDANAFGVNPGTGDPSSGFESVDFQIRLSVNIGTDSATVVRKTFPYFRDNTIVHIPPRAGELFYDVDHGDTIRDDLTVFYNFSFVVNTSNSSVIDDSIVSTRTFQLTSSDVFIQFDEVFGNERFLELTV